ncbi:MAG: formate dehydrogenase subunit alpha [Armatimonadota bacterium]
MAPITLTINGEQVSAHPEATLLEAALTNGIDIPRLCHDPRLEPAAACRLCVVEIEGQAGLHTSCTRLAEPGMVVWTESDAVVRSRRSTLELLLSEHNVSCTTCDADGSCLLQDYAYRYRVREKRFPSLARDTDREGYTVGNEGIVYDPSKCIRCQRCVRICAEVEMAEALTMKGRALDSEVSTGFDLPLNDSSCELCGLCVSTCPTAALWERRARGLGRAKDLQVVRTTCSYCGVGCQLELNVNPVMNRIVRVTAPAGCVPSDGNTCVKGRFGFRFVGSPERLRKPLIKEDGAFREASWEEALSLAGRRLAEIRDKYGPDAIAFLSSSRCTNEENYLMQKIARAAGRTNNIDQCATTCHAPTVAGLATAFGSGAMTNSIAEIKDIETLFIIGANPTEAHPIIGLEMKKALRRGAKLVVCDPRKTWMARRADLHIQHIPGTDNFLINAMMNHLLARGLYDQAFVAERCENFEAFRDNLAGYTVEEAARVCGVEADDIRRAAEMYAKGSPSSIFYTLGITEHTCGTENVQNLANLAMLCGQIGKLSSGVNPLRGQNNVQGACDMGAIHSVLPGYQRVTDPAVREKFGKAWGVDLPTNVGGRVTDFIEKAHEGVLKGFYVMGEDPALSEPDQSLVIESLKKLEFLVVQEIFMSETARLADVVLPATCFAEKDGTFTNTERRVQRVRKAVDPPGEARPDWQIVCGLSTAMGYPMQYAHPSEIFDEMASLTPSMAGISYDRIEHVGIQWPCPTRDHPGTKFLHEGRFTRGKGLFHAITFRPPAELPDAQYPFVLSTGRTLYHYNIGNMTRKSPEINQKDPDNFVELHSEDAQRLGIPRDGMARVTTRRGSVVVRARVGNRVRPGALWMPFHFAETATNRLTNPAFDNVTRTAEYKCCAARVEPAGE